MHTPIYITGRGLVSAIGLGLDETLASLRAQRSGVGPMRYLESRHREFPVGEVKLSQEELLERLGIAPREAPTMTRAALLGRLALEEALREAQLRAGALEEVHFISATTVGGMDLRERRYATEATADAQHAQIAVHSAGSCTALIAEPYGPFASCATVSTACSSALNALITGANMLRMGLAETVVVGGVESLTRFHFNGFGALMILDTALCRPFDRDRAGLNLGEGAAYLVLETPGAVARRGVRPLAMLSGYGNASDAYHQTASSPTGEGAYRSMQQALTMSGLAPEAIDYVHAHGTGTESNDASETVALRRLFGDQLPPVASTKAFTGHTTSTSGSVEAVICLLALEHQFLPVSLNWQTPMAEGLVPVTNPQPEGPIEHILTNAFGFGGNDATAIFSRIP